MEADTGSPMMVLISSDGEEIAVPQDVAEESMLITNMIRDLGDEAIYTPIPIPNVNAAVLKKIIEWCEHHKSDAMMPVAVESDGGRRLTEIRGWYKQFMQVDQKMLFGILIAANYLEIKHLLDLGCKTVADMIKDKTPEEISKIFDIQSNFKPEENYQKVMHTPVLPFPFTSLPPELQDHVIKYHLGHWTARIVPRFDRDYKTYRNVDKYLMFDTWPAIASCGLEGAAAARIWQLFDGTLDLTKPESLLHFGRSRAYSDSLICHRLLQLGQYIKRIVVRGDFELGDLRLRDIFSPLGTAYPTLPAYPTLLSSSVPVHSGLEGQDLQEFLQGDMDDLIIDWVRSRVLPGIDFDRFMCISARKPEQRSISLITRWRLSRIDPDQVQDNWKLRASCLDITFQVESDKPAIMTRKALNRAEGVTYRMPQVAQTLQELQLPSDIVHEYRDDKTFPNHEFLRLHL